MAQEYVDWTFGGTWPYAPRWFDSGEGRLHYVDEGPRAGRPIVLLHGNPTWGYLYRNFIPPLVDAGFRVIVPDHLGFGGSDKPDDPERYRVPRHAGRLEALLESLDLHDVTMVPQDWGGPIGLAWAGRHPERIRSLAIFNTMAHHRPQSVPIPLPLRLFRAPLIGEAMVKGMHAFVRGFLFKVGIAHRERITDEMRAAYLAPHPTWSSRTAILVFPREIPSGPVGRVSDFLTVVAPALDDAGGQTGLHRVGHEGSGIHVRIPGRPCGCAIFLTPKSCASMMPDTTSRKTRTSESCPPC